MVSERCADRLSALSTISSHIHIPLNPNGMALTVSVLASISDIVRSWRTLWLFVFTVFESLDLSAAPENGPAVIFTGHCIHTATYYFSYDRRQSIHYTVRGLISSFSDDRLSSESECMLDCRILAHSTHISPVKKCVALPRRTVAFSPNFFITHLRDLAGTLHIHEYELHAQFPSSHCGLDCACSRSTKAQWNAICHFHPSSSCKRDSSWPQR